jgi:tetratricopeptide (TPR) repeat protein
MTMHAPSFHDRLREIGPLIGLAISCVALAGCEDPGSSPDGEGQSVPVATQPSTRPVAGLSPALQAIVSEIQNRQTGPARIKLRNFLAQHPDDAQATFLFGLTYHREQKYGQALPYFEQALQLDPGYFIVHYFRAWSLYYLGQLEESRAAFGAYLAHAPDDYDAHFGLGVIALDEDELDDARAHLKRALEILSGQGDRADRKGLSKVRTRLSEVHEREGDLEAAQRELALAVELYPDHYEAYYKLSRVLTRLGRTDDAQRAYDSYLGARERLHPGSTPAPGPGSGGSPPE